MSVPRHPPLPVYEPADGNVFAWILRAAAQVRDERSGAQHLRWIEQEQARRQRQKATP